jgi:hypothetical protein
MDRWQRIILAGVIVLLAAIPSLACMCAGPREEESFKGADVVFIGKLAGSAGQQKEVFEVQQVLKGAGTGKLEVDTSQICDFHIFLGGQGTTYLVYAQKDRGKLSLKSCGGTRPVEEAKIPVANFCHDYGRQLSLREKASITTVCVLLSLSLGFLVTTLRKRFR